jgi:hypothetical protein
MKTANGHKLAHGLARYREERQDARNRVISEFSKNPQETADELIYLRGAVESVVEMGQWLKVRAPICLLGPGQRWQPQKSSERNS